MENHHFLLVNPLYMAIFNSYVCLPEGIRSSYKYHNDHNLWIKDQKIRLFVWGFEHLGNLGISIKYHNFSTSIVACIYNLIHEIPIGYSIISPQLTIGFEHRLVRLQVRQFP